jgi:cytochrome c551/c552
MGTDTYWRRGLVVLGIVGAVLAGRPASAAEEAAGRAVFIAKGCAVCHEERAVLQAPHLSALRRDRTFFQLSTDLWNHAPIMWANLSEPGLRWPRLTASEVTALAAYLNGAAPSDAAPDRRHGQLVLTQKQCLACHSLGGQGRGQAREMTLLPHLDRDAVWIAGLWNHIPSMIVQTPVQKVAYPTFEGQELRDLIGFLRDGVLAR